MKHSGKIRLSDHFTYLRLLRFTLPSIAMMLFTSIYGVVDGYFVSNFVGKTPFAAVNFIMPYLMILGALGFMFGAGGSALISKTLGEGKQEKARELFSMLVWVSFGTGVVVALLGIVVLRPAAVLLGAEGQMLEDCVRYGRVILMAVPAFMLQTEFQSFFVTAERPQLGLAVTLASGFGNMFLDWLLIGVWGGGLIAAAAATAISQVIGGVIPLVYFARKNGSLLHLCAFRFDGRALLRTCVNGSSELMSNISASLVGMLFNVQLMRYSGENGVAAYGVLMYVSLVFMAIFIGYSIGSAPIAGFHYGAQKYDELRSLLRKSGVLIGAASVGMLLLGEVLAMPLSLLFVGYDAELLELTRRGFLVYSFSFLFSGTAIYGSSFFTALNNGPVSACISFLRTLVFEVAAVLLLPALWGTDGIWLSIVVAEALAALVSVAFLIGLRKKYHYSFPAA